MNTFLNTLRQGEKYLEEKGIYNPKVDAYLIMSNIFNINKTFYLMNQDKEVDSSLYDKYIECIKLRAKGIPLQYILGVQEFMGLSFKVNEHVLIPRLETELLVEEVLKVCKGKSVLDLCTGSACIIISLSKLGEITKAVASDISVNALKLAKENAKINKVEIEFLESDLFDKINESFDIIVSNPPYIKTKEIDKLDIEVKDYEPFIALDGSEDGLEFYRRIIKKLNLYLKDNGYIFFEIGCKQGEEVRNLLKNSGFRDIKIIKDLSNHDRIVSARK